MATSNTPWLFALFSPFHHIEHRDSAERTGMLSNLPYFHCSPDLQPFQDLTSSGRVNLPQPDYTPTYPDFLGPSPTSSLFQASSSLSFSDCVLSPEIFCPGDQIRPCPFDPISSLDESPGLLSQPSPTSTHSTSTSTLGAKSGPATDPLSPSPVLVDPTHIPCETVGLGHFYEPLPSTGFAEAYSDVSPVVRAKPDRKLASVHSPPRVGPRRRTRRDGPKEPQTLVERLQGAPTTPEEPTTYSSHAPLLLSPCKLSGRGQAHQAEGDGILAIEAHPINNSPSGGGSESPPTPLTPLTPLSASPAEQTLTIVLPAITKRKRRALSPTPPRRSKRTRLSSVAEQATSSQAVLSPPPAPPSSRAASPLPGDTGLVPVFSTRTLPANIEISPKYSLFYRRFPASSYYQPPRSESPLTLFGVPSPGGLYNNPRSAFDLYTPRFVRGRGAEKVGLCPICIEPHERGGEHKKVWLAMKFSAFNYHMQYAHGISASTGRPFSPPIAFRTVPRVNPGKKEKLVIEQGKCHKCKQWVAVEGIKDMESKVKELYWWKHAASCHQNSNVPGEQDYFEDDDILAKLNAL